MGHRTSPAAGCARRAPLRFASNPWPGYELVRLAALLVLVLACAPASAKAAAAAELARIGVLGFVAAAVGTLLGIALTAGYTLGRRRARADSARQRDEIHRAIVSQAAGGITLVDLETLQFVEFNDTACGLLGYTREELAGLRLPDVQCVPEAELRAQLARIVPAGHAEFESVRRSRDGRPLDVRTA